MVLTAKDLIAKLQAIDPDEEIWVHDSDYGNQAAEEFEYLDCGHTAPPGTTHWFIF